MQGPGCEYGAREACSVERKGGGGLETTGWTWERAEGDEWARGAFSASLAMRAACTARGVHCPYFVHLALASLP